MGGVRGGESILPLALPAIVSNITVPLLGLVDTAIVGHMGAAEYIGAVSVGSMICTSIYWLFNFFRMGTSGLTSQEYGAGGETTTILRNSLLIAFAIGIAILVLFKPIEILSLFLMSPSAEVKPLVCNYFRICVIGAPAVLMQYSLTGWFIGMQDTKRPMVIAIIQNIFNILASLAFVYLFGMKVEGVALGTMLSQWFALLLGLWLYRRTKVTGLKVRNYEVKSFLKRFLSLNADIFLRTLCLMSVFFFFTSAGSKQGTEVLAVNALLMQTWLLFSYFMDGFANAGEALAGKYYGARDHAMLMLSVRRVFVWGGAVAAIFTLAYAFLLNPFLSLLTDNRHIVAAAQPYHFWIACFPLLAFAAFLWDGVFIGLTKSRAMLMGCLAGSMAFFTAFYTLFPYYGNHALWFAFLLFLLLRAAVQSVLFFRFRLME
ncbi:MAG: MATE family efflux transporter [Bacteroidaceae bacterium]|nr:MATE family efflux transporter [Bacteroidaceae bacterium]